MPRILASRRVRAGAVGAGRRSCPGRKLPGSGRSHLRGGRWCSGRSARQGGIVPMSARTPDSGGIGKGPLCRARLRWTVDTPGRPQSSATTNKQASSVVGWFGAPEQRRRGHRGDTTTEDRSVVHGLIAELSLDALPVRWLWWRRAALRWPPCVELHVRFHTLRLYQVAPHGLVLGGATGEKAYVHQISAGVSREAQQPLYGS